MFSVRMADLSVFYEPPGCSIVQTSKSSEKCKFMHSNGSFQVSEYDPRYSSDSPSEEIIQQCSPISSMSDRYGLQQTLFEDDSDDYDQDTVRLKVQELERALIEDTENLLGPEIVESNGTWINPVENRRTHESPKDSSCCESNLSSICSSAEISAGNCTTKQLLFDCAESLSEGNDGLALIIIEELRKIVSVHGDPAQRIAAYMVEALAARMVTSGKFLYKALRCKEPPSFNQLAAMQILFEICPCFKFGFVAANAVMIEAFKGERRVHIVDFDINQGNQYISLIQTLSATPISLPKIRLTGFDDPESIHRPVGGVKIVGQRLEKLAEILHVPFEFEAVPIEAGIFDSTMLHRLTGEALFVNFVFHLHHVPDGSVSTSNQRDELLRITKSLSPKLVTVVEQDVDTNTTPLFPRFVEAYHYYHAIFESLDLTLPRGSQDRMNVERHCLAREMVNIVACEGEERVERYEGVGKWSARMTMSGFAPSAVSVSVCDDIKETISKQYCDRYTVKEEMGALCFGWEERSLIVTSAWR